MTGILEITESDFLHHKETVKERMQARAGQEINLDSFLYLCYEEEKTQQALDENFTEQNYWPKLSSDQDFSPENFQEKLTGLMSFFKNEFEILKDNAAIDHEKVGKLVPPFILMLRDVKNLIKKCFSKDLESYDKESPDEIWQQLIATLRSSFSSQAERYLSYLFWLYQKADDTPLDLKSVPPEGRYAQLLFKIRNEKNYGSDRPRRGSSDRDRGGQAGHRRDRDRGGQGGHRRGGEKPARGPSSDRGRKNFKDNPPRDKEKDKEREKAALDEALKAIDDLNNDSSLSEVVLKPQNSFLRRIQHKEIVDRGFFSESVGEDSERAVKVCRPK